MNRNIMIIGAGGIGSFLIPLLDRTGLYDITVFDPDSVETKNLTYQNFKKGHVGQNKALVMRQEYSNVTHASKFKVLTPNQIDGYDIVVCCADNLDVRRLLYRQGFGEEANLKWLDTRAQGRNGAVISYKVDKNLASTLLAGKEGSFSCQGENWDGSAKGVNYMQVVVAGLAIQWLQNYFNNNEVFEYKVVNA